MTLDVHTEANWPENSGRLTGPPILAGGAASAAPLARPALAADRFNWLLDSFVRSTDGVRDAVSVSSDGLLIATSAGLDRTGADHLAAIVSSLASLGRSASKRYDFDGLKLIMIEMRRGFLIVSAMNGGACIGALADSGCDLGLIGYEIAVLAERFGDLLTPSLISESRRYLPQ